MLLSQGANEPQRVTHRQHGLSFSGVKVCQFYWFISLVCLFVFSLTPPTLWQIDLCVVPTAAAVKLAPLQPSQKLPYSSVLQGCTPDSSTEHRLAEACDCVIHYLYWLLVGLHRCTLVSFSLFPPQSLPFFPHCSQNQCLQHSCLC